MTTTSTEPADEHVAYTRLSCNISLDIADIIRRDKRFSGSATETVRRAIAVYKLVTDTTRNGGRVLIQSDKNKDHMQEVILL